MATLDELYGHQAWADAEHWRAIEAHDAALADRGMLERLHHIHLVQRAFTRPNLRQFAEKTVRWPGHFDGIDVLKSCGMLDLEPVTVDGQAVAPRAALLAAIEPRLRARPGDTDVCVMYNTVVGLRDNVRVCVSYFMWDEAVPETGISGMGRVTGFPAAIGAFMIGKKMIKERGLVPPEDAVYGEHYGWFLSELERHRIRIAETVEPIAATSAGTGATTRA